MRDCILADPEERPSFEELDKRLKRVDIEERKQPTDDKTSPTTTTVSLFDIFPKHIAETLAAGKQVEPSHHDCVTIFFSDIVGYTELASTMEPRKVANMLDRLYSKLDSLSSTYDIFKVETIGDSYMCCSNLIKDQSDDHVKRIAEFAIEAIRAANQTLIDEDSPDRGFVDIRVGFHSGPVVADVVGSRNPRYCLFGDTVNTGKLCVNLVCRRNCISFYKCGAQTCLFPSFTMFVTVASRMESNSKPNRVQCSESSVDLLKEQGFSKYQIKSRGTISVKGKGDMKTYWINEGPGALASKTRNSLDKTEPAKSFGE